MITIVYTLQEPIRNQNLRPYAAGSASSLFLLCQILLQDANRACFFESQMLPHIRKIQNQWIFSMIALLLLLLSILFLFMYHFLQSSYIWIEF